MLVGPVRPRGFRKGAVSFVLEDFRLPLTYFKAAGYLRRRSVRKMLEPYP